jgi:hypothetical protein
VEEIFSGLLQNSAPSIYEGCPKIKVTQSLENCSAQPHSLDLALSGLPRLQTSREAAFGKARDVTSGEEFHCEVRSWLMGLDTDLYSGTGNLVKR